MSTIFVFNKLHKGSVFSNRRNNLLNKQLKYCNENKENYVMFNHIEK